MGVPPSKPKIIPDKEPERVTYYKYNGKYISYEEYKAWIEINDGIIPEGLKTTSMPPEPKPILSEEIIK